MKRVLVLLAVLVFAAAAPVLACGEEKAAKVAKAGFCMKSAEKVVKNIDNGVEIHFVAANAEQAAYIEKAVKSGKLLGCEGQCPTRAKSVKRNVERTKDAVIVRATSPDAQMVSHLQQEAKKLAGA